MDGKEAMYPTCFNCFPFNSNSARDQPQAVGRGTGRHTVNVLAYTGRYSVQSSVHPRRHYEEVSPVLQMTFVLQGMRFVNRTRQGPYNK
jgi:hypothetical protein